MCDRAVRACTLFPFNGHNVRFHFHGKRLAVRMPAMADFFLIVYIFIINTQLSRVQHMHTSGDTHANAPPTGAFVYSIHMII